MNTLFLFMSVLGISFASPIKGSANLPGHGYEENMANINTIHANKEILSNGSGNAGRNQQNGENENYGHQEGVKFNNYTSGPNKTGKVSAIDINNPLGAYMNKSNNQLTPEDPENTHGTQSIDQNDELQTGTGINRPHLDLHVNMNHSEQSQFEHLTGENSIHGSARVEEDFVLEDEELSTGKQDVISSHNDSSLNVGKKDDDVSNGHHHSGSCYFNDEGMQRIDPGNAGDSGDANSSQQGESNSDSVESAPKNCKSMPSESKSSSKSAQENTSDSSSPSESSLSSNSSESSNSGNSSESSNSSNSSETRQ